MKTSLSPMMFKARFRGLHASSELIASTTLQYAGEGRVRVQDAPIQSKQLLGSCQNFLTLQVQGRRGEECKGRGGLHSSCESVHGESVALRGYTISQLDNSEHGA